MKNDMFTVRFDYRCGKGNNNYSFTFTFKHSKTTKHQYLPTSTTTQFDTRHTTTDDKQKSHTHKLHIDPVKRKTDPQNKTPPPRHCLTGADVAFGIAAHL